MGGMDRYYQRQKEKANKTQTHSGGGLDKFYQRQYYNSIDTSGVDQKYRDTFFTDAKNFLSSAEKDLGSVGWGNASSSFDSLNTSWGDLSTRADTIGAWLYKNKGNIKEEDYNNLYKTLDDFRTSGSSVLESFKGARDYYAKWESEDAYNNWYAEEQRKEAEKNAVLGAADFEQYFNKGNEYSEAPSFLDKLTGNTGYNSIAEMRNDPNALKIYEDSAKSANGGSWGTPERQLTNQIEYKAAKWMTDDEFKVYNYYYAKDRENGTDTATQFLNSIEETLNLRAADEKFADLQGNTLKEIFYGFAAGLDQFESGIINLGNMITGDSALATPTQITAGKVREDLADNGPEIFGSSLGQAGYDFVSTTANMLPSILVGSFTGGLGGALTLGASATGNAYNEMRNLGYTENQARVYGALVGASETLLSSLFSGIYNLGGKLTGNALSKFVSGIDNALAKTAITLGGKMFSEGLEESAQEVLDPIFKWAVTLGEEEFEGIDWEQVFYSGLLGALSAGMMEGGSTISGEVSTYEQGKVLKDMGKEGVDRLVSLGKTLSADSVAYKIADKVNEKTGAYTVGRLLNEVGASLSEQNKADISKALIEKGMTEKDAATISKWLGKAVDGGYFNKRQAATLESNEVISSVFKEVILDQNSALNQRIQGYNDIRNEAQNPTEKLSDEEIISRIAEVTGDDAETLMQNYKRRTEGAATPLATPTSEAATEPLFKASESGKTMLIPADGETEAREVSIKEIASINNGEITLRLEDGSLVGAKDVELGSDAEVLLYENVAQMGLNPATANAFVKGFTPGEGLSAEMYAQGFAEAYRYGTYGIPMSEMSRDGFSAELTEAQRTLAYNLGKTDAKYKFAPKKAESAKEVSAEEAKEAPKGAKKGKLHNKLKPTNETQRASLKALGVVAEALGIDIYTYESEVVNGKRQYTMPDGTVTGANGWFDKKDNSIHIDLYAGASGEGTMLFTAAHELTHFIREWSPDKFKTFADFLFEKYGEKGVSVDELIKKQIAKAAKKDRVISYDTAYEEVVADACEMMLTDSNAMEKIAELKDKDKSLWEKIKEFITGLVARIKAAYEGLNPDSTEADYVREMKEAAEKLQALWTEALMDAGKANLESDFAEVDTSTESVAPAFSERTWTESDYVLHRDEMAEKIAKALDVSIEKAKGYIDDINSIAKMIADDRVRLDYEASSFGSAFVSNVEYGGSFDYTTLCKKRRIYTGTFTEIQKRLKDVALTPDDILKIRNLMIEEGIEATCGLCYVEGSRANMGKFAKEFIRLYKRDNPDAWIPNMADVNTPDGVEQMRISHPEAYEQYEYFWNHYGKLKDSDPALFASQQKPKLYEARKEYKGEILEHFSKDTTVEKKNLNGGIRMQSFSDFEIVHLIDTMQVIMDMSTVGLAGQAYTKVPEFAEAFGNTGLKINLSLIAKGVDADGKLIFDDREGMPHKTAFDLRNKYSKDVGTIIVTFTDEQLLAAMADPRIDYIIPFHRSQWKKGQYGAMGLPKGTKDYTYMQNEKLIKKTYHEYRGRMVADKATNYMPNEYWDFSKSGKENAEAYLKMCAENNKRPKFYKLLDYDGNGTYSLKKDGSTDGYWKLLIDFKMYDNDGAGSPQMAVTPTFTMDKATKMLDEYKGGHSKYPVASSVVDTFVEQYNEDHGVMYSDRDSEGKTLSKEQQEFFKDSKVRDKDGNLMVVYHGTNQGDFNTFLWDKTQRADGGFFGRGHYFTSSKGMADLYGKRVIEAYLNIKNPFVWDEQILTYDGEKPDNLVARNIISRINMAKVFPSIFSNNTMTGFKYNSDSGEYEETTIKWSNLEKEINDVKDRLILRQYYDGTYKWFTEGRFWEEEVGESFGTQEAAEKGKFVPAIHAFLRKYEGIERDMSIDDQTTYTQQHGAEITEELKKLGYDGAMQTKGGDEIVAFESNQIKRTDNTSPTSDPDIRYSDREVTPITEAETKELEKHFGTTGNFKVAGYLLTDGKLLDFSGKHWGDTTSRTRQVDHRDVQEVIGNRDSMNGTNAMIDMIGSGNIRLMPEDGGINLAVYPNEKQRRVLSTYINYMLATEGQVIIDYDAPGGDTVYSKEYGKYATSRQILADIRNYFNGARQSDLMQFHTMYSERDTDSMSTRSLLAGALESVAQNDIERKYLQQYKETLYLVEGAVKKLAELRKKIEEARYAPSLKDQKTGEAYSVKTFKEKALALAKAKGISEKEVKFKLDSSKMEYVAYVGDMSSGAILVADKTLQDRNAIALMEQTAVGIENNINTYDKQLLRIEALEPMKKIIHREREFARKKGEAEGKKALEAYKERAAKTQRELMNRYQESRKAGIESRNKTAVRHKIKNVVDELNQYLLKGTHSKHVPIELQKAVAEALDAVNMDTVSAEERIAAKRAEMLRAKTPEKIERLAKEIETIREQGGNMAKKISRLKTAYDSIINSDDPLIANSHDEVISSTIGKVLEVVGETPLRDMSLYQLEAVYDMYKMVLHSIREANKAFKAKKSEEISVIANRVLSEMDGLKKKKKLQTKAGQAIAEFDWNNQKPIYAFERIGSGTFTEVFENVRAGEDTWAADMSDAQAFREEQYKKHGYSKWDFNKKHKFTSATGNDFELTLGQIMSLYAYSKRGEQATEHLRKGGFVFDGLTEVKEKTKLGTTKTLQLKDATAYNLSEETLGKIISELTPEQTAFADAMQTYLSDVMGEKGNEVSLELYGVKLFKEKNYFPLKSATQFMAKAKEQAQGETKIKNKGFTKETNPKANNPIVLTPFMDVWAGHVNEMSMYHAFTLAMEDFYRVFNYKTPAADNMESVSVVSFLENAHGEAATKYIDQLLKDLNGGARSDARENIAKKAMSNFKKASVMASFSVVIQQPSAIVRAQALVDAKHFLGKKVSKAKHKELWAEVKKYAPVAIIKEMGYFDVGMGKSSTEWLKGEKTLGDKMEDFLSLAPAKADEYTWCAIWQAVKRETLRKNPKLNPTTEEFLKMAGERFTEVIAKTQVYDSTLSRSANMRSKSGLMQMWTAFMAEPTTSINMLQEAFNKGKGIKHKARVMGAVYGSVLLNSALVSIIYAMRDDDEDETWWEKYFSRLTTEIIDGINPLTYIPFVKDIWSAAQGFDIERADMTLITSLFDSMQGLINVAGKDTTDMEEDEKKEHGKEVTEAILSIVDNISSLTGIPVKNVRRDIKGIINGITTIMTDVEGRPTTGTSLGDAILGDFQSSIPVWGWFPGKSKGDKVYNAIDKGDEAYTDRLKDTYKDEQAFNTSFANHIQKMYKAGTISKEKAVSVLVSHGGKTEEDAASKVQYWEFKKQYPKYDLSEEAVAKYYSDIEPAGIGADTYYDYYKQKANAKGTDLNGDGKTDSGSKKAEVMNIINSLPISRAQKDALYFANGWAASTLHEAPWH